MALLLTSVSFNFSLFMDRDELGQVAILTEQAIQSHARLMNPTLKGSVCSIVEYVYSFLVLGPHLKNTTLAPEVT